MYEVHEFLSCLCLFEGSAEVTCRSDGVLFLHTSHLHAHVFCLHDDDDPLWMKSLVDAVLYLLRHSLLHLQAMAEDIHDTCYLAQSCDVAVRYVGYMHLAVEIILALVNQQPWRSLTALGILN